MRTTLNLDDQLMRAARQRAVDEGTTLTSVIERALRHALAEPSASTLEPVDLPVFEGNGPAQGVDVSDPRALRDAMFEDEDARYRAATSGRAAP